jgi:RimJ/RimL family protein N-acetyltransferase
MLFETPRLILRRFQDADLEAFVTYRSDPEVARYQGWDAPYSRERAAAFIAEMKSVQAGIPGAWLQLAIEIKGKCGLIGDCAFHILPGDPRQAEIAFTLARASQGQGYATEAVTRLLAYLFDDLHLHRVTAICDVENQASFRLLERLGLRREATFLQNVWFKGAWGSEYLYAMLQSEWQARQPM